MFPFTEASPESSFPKSVGTLSSSNSPSAKTNKRTHFTPQQIYKLEQFFLKSQFPTAKDRETLAKELQLSVKHIQVYLTIHKNVCITEIGFCCSGMVSESQSQIQEKREEKGSHTEINS